MRSFSLLPTSSSALHLRLGPFMAKLHCRALENHSTFPFSFPFGGATFHDGLQSSRHLNLRPSSSILPFNRLNTHLVLKTGASPSFSNAITSPKRHFFNLSKLLSNKKEKNLSGFSKHWKRPPTHSKPTLSSSHISASNDVDVVATSELPLEGVKEASPVPTPQEKQNSKRNTKRKKQPTTGRKKDSLASENPTAEKSPTSTSQAKKSVAAKDSLASTNSSEVETEATVSIAQQVPDGSGSGSAKPQSNKKSGKSGKTKKAAKAVNESIKAQKIGKLEALGQGTLKQLYPPTGKSVVVVESLTKARVIQQYLGDMYQVLPSYGHVRDLAARSGSVRPDDDFSMVWEVPSAAWTYLKSIKVALTGAENLILASDPDREGEAIAWHIFEMLQQQDALSKDMIVARVVFHEITEASIKNALLAPREIDANLVHAYLARRALDYLIGFNISPLLWRKLPGCQSAGRVQSAALSLICDREMEIDEFKPQEYWTVEANLKKKESDSVVKAQLAHFDSQKLNQFSISSHTEANNVEQKINSTNFQVVSHKSNKMQRNPPTPYITSTLQQDAANKLYFSATTTMKLAQKLYEGIQLSDGKAAGLITYLRTDGLHISEEAVKGIHSLVIERYGPDFAAKVARKYFKKVKNAQEAHEAIRPTNIQVLPSMLVDVLDEDSLKLYTLIWSRTVACQMEPATIEQVQVEIGNASKSIIFRSASSRVDFPGYQAVYKDIKAGALSFEEDEANVRQEAFAVLISLKLNCFPRISFDHQICVCKMQKQFNLPAKQALRDPLRLGEVDLKQKFTSPPPRYSEGSLVKKLEELGIGRPSTYASTIKVLKDRNYLTVRSRQLYPEFRGRMVTAFLSNHFTEVTDYSFTADMETELDNVSAGLTEWKGLLRDYWTRFHSYCTRTESVHIHQVEKMLEKTFGDFLFGSLPDNSRACPSCLEGTLIFKVSKFGAGYFIGCDQHPKCKYIAKTLYGDEDDEETPQNNKPVEEPKLLGLHPVSNEKILLKNGPYGYYVQLGEDRKGYIPKRASASHIKDVQAITVEDAVDLLRYPVTLGTHPKDGHPVVLKLAKVGFSVRHRRTIATVPKNMKPESITMEKALKLLSSDDVRRCGRPKNKPKVEEAVEAT